MAFVRWEPCDSSPAKRAKMELDSVDWLASVAESRGVSSSSDNMGECFNGGDSGFNELIPSTSSECDDLLLFGKKQSEEPDSSMLDYLGDYNDILLENPDDNDNDDVASTISHISGLSDLSDLSGQDWKPIAGPMGWVQQQMHMGANPRTLIQDLVPPGTHIPVHLDDIMLWKIILNMLSEPPCRKKLAEVNTLENAVELIHGSKNIIVLTGAGVSVSCGIPDFRSKDGVYARLAKDFPDLPDPQAMFDINYFRKDPRPFFKFAKEIYPGQFEPSPSHRFIKLVEGHGKLLRNYSQNIDTLEQIAGIQRVIQCHGSFATASCTSCHEKVEAAEIRDDVLNQKIPQCTRCERNDDSVAVMKPDIVFFGEGLPEEFHSTMAKDKDQCDLLIVIGSSLKVRPVALIPNSLPGHVPQILINREPLRHLNFDVELLGDCDVIVNELCLRLGDGWEHLATSESLKELLEIPSRKKDAGTTPPEKPQGTFAQFLSASTSSGCGSNLPSSSTCNNAPCDNNECDSTSDKESNNEPDSSSALTSSKLMEENSKLIYGVKQYVQNSNLDSTDREDVELTSVDDLEALRACWKPQPRENVADRLPDRCFLFVPPNRYLFKGAEVFSDPEVVEPFPNKHSLIVDSNSDELRSSSSPGSTSDVEDDTEKNGAKTEFMDERTGSGDDSGVGDMKVDDQFVAHSSTKMEDEVIGLDWTSSSSR